MTRYLGHQFGDYRLVRLLGTGGFAEVYEAEHLHLPGTKAAIKILKDAFTQKQIEELRKEALIVNTLDHPHIVRLLGFGIERNIPYLIMSYAPGGSLDRHHPRNTQLPLPTIVSYVRQAANALQAAHTRGIIHRDIKPANLLLAQDGRVQIGDFGIALMAQNSTSWTQQEIAGTWVYMSPEQFDGHAQPASDQYSLAIMVYQWLCGTPPFTGDGSIFRLPLQHKTQPPPSLQEKLPGLSPAVERVVFKALAKDPEERFASVRGFAEALEEASQPPFVPAPGQCLGDYRLVHRLGEGGFAEVYEAEHVHLGTKAAIKLLKGELSPQLIEGLRQEARLVMNLDHPQIVRVLGFSLERRVPYLVMAHAPGGSLDLRHPRGTRLPLETILAYVRQIAAALQYAHEQGIVHRDIKPGNFLLAKDGRVLVADFGIAAMAQTTQSRTQQEIVGTWLYMAPEQFEGQAGPASDQYSLALVVYQWLCGDPPFTGQGNIHALPYQQMHTPPPSLWKRVPDLSLAIEQVVMKALAKKPEERWASVQAFAAALEQASKKPAPGTTLLTYEHLGGCINTVAWSLDGKRLASGGDDTTIRIWNASTGKPLLTLRGHSDAVHAMAWSPDDKWLASASWDGMVQVWEASSGKLLRYMGHSSWVYAVAWSPDGKWLASASEDGMVQVWEAVSGQLLHSYTGHSDEVRVVVWSPDGNWLASASYDKTVQVWEASSGERLLTYRGHYGPVKAVAWSPDGERIASAGYEVHIWQVG